MRIIEGVIKDRGSRYAVSGGAVADENAAKDFIKALKRNKKFAKATHNTWAMIAPDGTQIKADDGEAGAGAIILRMLEREAMQGDIIVVTRWYGGKHLGGDRFRHVQDCVTAYLADLAG